MQLDRVFFDARDRASVSRPLHPFAQCSLVLLLSVSPIYVRAQAPTPAGAPQPGPQQGMSGGVNTGGTFAPVLDAQKRPITAGGFVDSGAPIFIDIAEKAGLSKWSHRDGTKEKEFILETPGSGVPRSSTTIMTAPSPMLQPRRV
jgi:hypothetical protein